MSRDYVLQYHRRLFQIPAQSPRPRPGDRVVVRRWLDGSLHFSWNDKPLRVEEVQIPEPKEVPESLSA